MKKNSKLPTILGLIILIFGVVTGVVLINSRQVFRIGASVETTPKNIRVSNITESSATITWTTDKESSGFVKWGKSNSTTSKVSLEDNSEKSIVHSANILGIEPNSQVYFKINSDSNDYDNEGVGWNFKTLPSKVGMSNNLIASGTVLNANASTPAKAIVYLNINSTVLSGTTSKEGNFVIPISSYVDQIIDTQAIEITVQGGTLGTSQAVIYPKSITAIPTIVLGKTYDFRTAENITSDLKPTSDLTIPESVELSSRFEITKNENKDEEGQSVSIDSIDEGEIITTTDPEFFGTGPANSEITIEIHSELQTENISTNSKGSWNWSPPNNLEPGEHKIVVKWKDASGILRTLTKTFVVSAAEGPAFESTPSATPENTATVKPTASSTSQSTSSATPKITSSPIATNQPVPETGSLTPTIGLFMFGIGLVLMAFLLSKNAIN